MIYFTGDINLTDNSFDIGFGVGSMIKKGQNPFQYIEKNIDDIWVGNFEGVVADVSNLSDFSKDSFRITTSLMQNVANFIDYWGISNNHVMEHGVDAYNQMESVLNDNSKGVFGSDKHPFITFKHRDKSLSILGFCLRVEESQNEAINNTYPEFHELEEIYKKIKDSDYKIAYIHWGVEFVNYPSVSQKMFAHWLIDMGFDLIVGMHPHVMQGYEIYKGKHIFYSLGNFVFHMPYEPTQIGAIVKLDEITGEVSYDYISIDNNYFPHIIREMEIKEIYRYDYLNKQLANNKKIEAYILDFQRELKLYRKENRLEILRNIPKYDFSVFKGMVAAFIKRFKS